jgi:hypothetical protein
MRKIQKFLTSSDMESSTVTPQNKVQAPLPAHNPANRSSQAQKSAFIALLFSTGVDDYYTEKSFTNAALPPSSAIPEGGTAWIHTCD